MTVAKNILNPWQGVAETAALQIPFIKRQPMRPQDHLEFFEKRNAPMMFFLPFDVTTNLRNLRLAHTKRAVTLLPREARRPFERARNPTRRVRLDFADQLRERLILPQFCQDVDVVRGSVTINAIPPSPRIAPPRYS